MADELDKEQETRQEIQPDETTLNTPSSFAEVMKALFELFKKKVLSWLSKVEEGQLTLDVQGEQFNYSVGASPKGGTYYRAAIKDVPDNKKAAVLEAMCEVALRASPNAQFRVTEGKGADDLRAALDRVRAKIAKENQAPEVVHEAEPVLASSAPEQAPESVQAPPVVSTPTPSLSPVSAPVLPHSRIVELKDEILLAQLDRKIIEHLLTNPDQDSIPKDWLAQRDEVLPRVMRARASLETREPASPEQAREIEVLNQQYKEESTKLKAAQDQRAKQSNQAAPLAAITPPSAPQAAIPSKPVTPSSIKPTTPPPSSSPSSAPVAPQAQAGAPGTKLVCIDFDLTITDKHVHNSLSEQGTPRPIHENGACILKGGVISDPNNPNRNFSLSPQEQAKYQQNCQKISQEVPLKEPDKMRDTIRTTLANGGKVAITSFNNYPHAIPGVLERIGLRPDEISQVTIVTGFPKEGETSPNGKKEHMELAAQVVSQESGVTIQKSDTMLVDDSAKNVTASKEQGYSEGVLVKPNQPTDFSPVTRFSQRPAPQPEPAPGPKALTDLLEANPAPPFDPSQFGPPAPPKPITPGLESFQENQPPLAPKPERPSVDKEKEDKEKIGPQMRH